MRVSWIPVEDKLPEPDHTILCSLENGTVDTGEYFFLKSERRYTFGFCGWEFKVPVLAWCELPEPYRRDNGD